MTPSVRRLLLSGLLVTTVVLAGGAGLYALGAGRWELGEAMYMAVISVSTVGFGEIPGFEAIRGARVLTVAIIAAGLGTVAFFQSSLTALIVEGVIGSALRRRKMKARIDALADHIVVAGVGSTGRQVVEELHAAGTPFVAVDVNLEQLNRVNEEIAGGEMLFVHGDASEDHTLHAAGIDRAAGLVAALTHDKDNLYVTLSARSLNARARIVTKVVEPEARAKMLRAGATVTVSPNVIGGRRMASEAIRPAVVEFLDQMVREKDRSLRFHDVLVPADSPYAGKPLGDLLTLPGVNLLIVAAREPDGRYHYNPRAAHSTAGGGVLIVLGELADVKKLKDALAGKRGG